MKMTDPFTRTPGVAGKAYIDSGVADEIIQAFCDENSSKYVYKITGLRGSGKSVEYSRVLRTLKEKDGWLVYPLSSSGDGIRTLISKLSMEEFIDSKKSLLTVKSSTSLEGKVIVASGKQAVDITKALSDNEDYYSQEATLVKMIETANKKNHKVLIGIDDISKTPAMVELLSLVSSMVLEGLKVYLIVTGLSQNIEAFSTEKNLSFFKRADSLEIKSLNKYDIVFMYQKLLGVNEKEAKTLEEITAGYAYAYQVLGSLYFRKQENDTVEDLMPDFERILFRDSYDLIWKSITEREKELIRCIYRSKTGKTSDIKELMTNKANYSVVRERLINKHIIDGGTRGYLRIRLPRFDRYIELWGDE